MLSRLSMWSLSGKVDTQDELRRDAGPWNPRHVGAVAAGWLVGAMALALLSVAARSHEEFPGDVGVTQALQTLRDTLLAPPLTFVSDANWPTPAGIMALGIIVALALVRHFRAALCTAVAAFGADLANVTLNGLVARPRPHNAHIHVVAHLGLHSFPSGHVTHVIALYGFLFYLAHHQGKTHPSWRPWLRAVQALCVYFMVAIGPARVLLGEHWPSDVVASYLLGALVMTLAIGLYHLIALAWVGYQARARHEPVVAA